METESNPPTRTKQAPQNHRTIDRVTQIIETVVYNPGINFAELVRAVNAAKSSVHGFVNGLLASGWLFQENGKFYLGPTIYGLTLANGHLRSGFVSWDDLNALHDETETAAFLGIQAGDHLMYIAVAGQDPVISYEAKSNIRRHMLKTAGGKALLAAQPNDVRDAYLRRRPPDDRTLVEQFLSELEEIQRTGIAKNFRSQVRRYAIAGVVHDRSTKAMASVTLVGPAEKIEPKLESLCTSLKNHIEIWTARSAGAATPV